MGKDTAKQGTVERPDIPNQLDHEFAVEQPDQVWCGDMPAVSSVKGSGVIE